MARGWVEARGKRYRAVVLRDDGSRVTKHFEAERPARLWKDDRLHDIRHGIAVVQRSGVTFKELVDQFVEDSIDVRASTAARDKALLTKHAVAAFGSKRIADIDQAAVQRWVNTLSRSGLAPLTVRKVHELMRRVLEMAVGTALVTNPCRSTRLPRVEEPDRRFLTPLELATLASKIDKRYRAFILLSGYGGLRIGEMAGLRRGCVDLAQRFVEVKEIAVEVGGEVLIGPPKTRKSRRRVPIPPAVAAELERHMEKWCEPGAQAFVFTAPKGGPLRSHAFRHRFFKPAVEAAELKPLRVHDLRHTAASIWIAAGVHQRELMERLGHTSITMTNIYGHLFPTADADFADRVGSMYVAPPPAIDLD